MCFRIFRMNKDEDTFQYTTKIIAFALITIFLLVLIWSGIVSTVKDDETWFNLYKEGFLLLAGAITTIIGYYFGSRRAEAIENQYRTMNATMKRSRKEVDTALNMVKELKMSLPRSDDPVPVSQPQMEVDPAEVPGMIDPTAGGN